ncbi:MAG TPA: nucleoside hydrolase [Opitutaceae bacterium]|nr:nucleoside hydrolase [Opitutaceae bacterium]
MESKIKITRRQLLGGAIGGGLSLLTAKFSWAESLAGPPTPTRRSGVERVIIDADPGNDDALAILMALDAATLHVEAITVCPGNLGPHYQQQVRNALYIVDLAGKSGQVPVHAGMSRSILNKPYPIASFIHGKFGLGRVEVPDVAQKAEREHAVDAICRLVNQSPGEITIAALGGLTNVAMAILKDPDVAKNLKGILFVGGRYATPGLAPGYNVLVDPEAAHVVLTSGVPMTLVGSDVFRNDSVLVDADFDRVANFNTRRSRFFIESNDLRRTFEKANRGTTGSTNPDPITIATLINPAIALRYVSVYMHVELQGESTRGLLVYGDNIYTGEPTPPANVKMCIQASSDEFKRMVFETLSKA